MNKNNLIKDYKLKIFFLKNEHKLILLKNILQRTDCNKMLKQFIKFKLSSWKVKTRISFQRRVCLILGKNRSVYPKLNLKRHTIKKMNATCLISGLSMGKW